MGHKTEVPTMDNAIFMEKPTLYYEQLVPSKSCLFHFHLLLKISSPLNQIVVIFTSPWHNLVVSD